MNRRALLTALAGLPFCKGLLPKAEGVSFEHVRWSPTEVDINRTEPLSPYEGLIMQGWVGPQLQYELETMRVRGAGVEKGSTVVDMVTGYHRVVEQRDDGLWVFA